MSLLPDLNNTAVYLERGQEDFDEKTRLSQRNKPRESELEMKENTDRHCLLTHRCSDSISFGVQETADLREIAISLDDII